MVIELFVDGEETVDEINADWNKQSFDFFDPETGLLAANEEQLAAALKHINRSGIERFKKSKNYENLITALDAGTLDEDEFGWLRDIGK